MIHMTFGDSLPRVQFQLGKAISETAGVVITRIVQIRETNDEHKNRAIIVDTSIADISSPHFHPIYWMNKQMRWQLLKAGSDVCWGRTCMEFDRILIGIELPSGALLGDLLMITSCGAYDFSNSYEFGDGESRNISIIR
jgi:diaminopimelate decarboxylase